MQQREEGRKNEGERERVNRERRQASGGQLTKPAAELDPRARMRAAGIVLISVALTCAVIGNAYYQKKQFYPSVVYITKSNPSMAVSSLFPCSCLFWIFESPRDARAIVFWAGYDELADERARWFVFAGPKVLGKRSYGVFSLFAWFV